MFAGGFPQAPDRVRWTRGRIVRGPFIWCRDERCEAWNRLARSHVHTVKVFWQASLASPPGARVAWPVGIGDQMSTVQRVQRRPHVVGVLRRAITVLVSLSWLTSSLICPVPALAHAAFARAIPKRWPRIDRSTTIVTATIKTRRRSWSPRPLSCSSRCSCRHVADLELRTMRINVRGLERRRPRAASTPCLAWPSLSYRHRRAHERPCLPRCGP